MKRDTDHGRTGCDGIEILLTAYAAGDLGPGEVADVERHLADCPDCRGELARERILRDTLASMPLVPCPEPVTDRIMAVVDADVACETAVLRRTRSERWRRAGVGLLAAAAVFALMVLAPSSDRSADPVADVDVPTWSDDEIRTARGEIRYTLALAASIIEKSEKSTISEVFGRQLPGVVTKSVKAVTSSLEGGQG